MSHHAKRGRRLTPARPADGKPATIFQSILDGKIPSTKVYDDELIYAFRVRERAPTCGPCRSARRPQDIAPTAKTHIVIIPKDRDGLTGISQAEERHAAVLGHLMVKAAEIAKAEGLAQGYRLVVNEGEQGCQSVAHLHVHLIGGQQLTWPPGTGKAEGSMTG